MKIVIIGGVAAGTKAAAKLKRENPNDEIVIYTKGKDISYAGCGLPYYIGGAIETEGDLQAPGYIRSMRQWLWTRRPRLFPSAGMQGAQNCRRQRWLAMTNSSLP